MTEIQRVITFFNRNDDDFVGEINLPEINLAELQELFSVQKENPMYECYKIEQKHVAFFKKLVNIDFDFEKYEYFCECYALP